MRLSLHIKVLIPFVIIFIGLAIFAPRVPKWAYEYKKGSKWKYETLYAQFDFPILKSEAQITEELEKKSASTTAYFKYDFSVGDACISKASTLFSGQGASEINTLLVHTLKQIYARGVLPPESAQYSSDQYVYIQRDKRAQLNAVSELYQVSTARAYLQTFLQTSLPSHKLDSVLFSGELLSLVKPNLVFDSQTTALFNSHRDNTISPTMGYVNAGEIIVTQGEIVTAEIVQMLDSYKAEYETSVSGESERFGILIGNTLLALAIVLVLYYAIFFPNRKVFVSYNHLLFILTLFAAFAALTLAMIKIDAEYIFLVPFTLASLTLQSFFKVRKVLLIYIALLLPMLVFCENGAMLFTMYLVAGFASFQSFPTLKKGASQFLMALIVFAVLVVVFLAFSLSGAVNLPIISTIFKLMIGSALTVAGYPLVYLFEKVFGLVSESTLQEITDSSNELLRKLEQKAPGTFQHSLQMKNIATACARALGADELLVKAGALFHDIGKMNNPLCFVENESLVLRDDNGSYHADITPLQSAQDIIKHVSDGVDLARMHHLPKSVIAFIESHHGTSVVSYFYDKFLKEGGDESMRSEFCYKGMKPHTIEEVILMISDSVEAASRTLRSYSPEAISELVESIVEGKISQGQLSEADVTIRELETMKAVMKSYIQQVNHERIKYPKRNR